MMLFYLTICLVFCGSYAFYIPDDFDINDDEIESRVASWNPRDGNNAWELSGRFEGDIFIDPEEARNGLKTSDLLWPGGVVPYQIHEDDFSDENIDTIKKAIEDYHSKTCIKFRKKKLTDTAWITVRGENGGCYSRVGRKGLGEQIINLQRKGCVHHGTIIHEFLHALGFFHQQSSSDRDEYIKVNWDNIEEGKENNFQKYNTSIITNFNITYDYESVMHYSEKAFSKNGEPTIEPIEKNVIIGQRKGFSEKDILKLQKMYEKECTKRDSSSNNSWEENFLLSFFEL